LPTIKKGDNGDYVKVAAYLTGFAKKNEAGDTFTQEMHDFIAKWQKGNGLAADGIIGSKTWTKIAETLPTCSTSKNKDSTYTCAVQILIGGLTVDGVYGTKTKQGVAAYQSANGLEADGKCGPKTWKKLIVTKDSEKPDDDDKPAPGKTINKCVHYLQWDSKWKNKKYSTHTSKQTIGNSGCGPTSMAQIMATWIDPKITPVEMCELAIKGGYRTYDSGTAWGYFKYVFKQYDGFSKYIETKSVETLKSALAEGALAVCSMNSNDNKFWTSGGHYITAIGFDSDGYIYANDPNKASAPRKQKQDKFKSCMKQAFIFWPQSRDSKGQDAHSEPTDDGKQQSVVDGAIIDISYHQGKIDFDKLKSKVSFVIVRASCGSDLDTRFDEYARAMNECKIPFGVYCYSYAGTVEKAKDEAQKLVKYASGYNPLFYVMDAEEDKITNAAIKAFAKELRALGVERIGCYVAHNHYNDYNYDSLRSKFNFTWIPRYGGNTGKVEGSTKPAYICDLWQYTSRGKIDGISGNVDMNTITGQGKTLAWFLGGE